MITTPEPDATRQAAWIPPIMSRHHPLPIKVSLIDAPQLWRVMRCLDPLTIGTGAKQGRRKVLSKRLTREANRRARAEMAARSIGEFFAG